jgi:hypothetical protein
LFLFICPFSSDHMMLPRPLRKMGVSLATVLQTWLRKRAS